MYVYLDMLFFIEEQFGHHNVQRDTHQASWKLSRLEVLLQAGRGRLKPKKAATQQSINVEQRGELLQDGLQLCRFPVSNMDSIHQKLIKKREG